MGHGAILVALARRGVRFSGGFVAGAFRPELLVSLIEGWEELASYAKQADDETLFKTAMRIKGRAVRRVGELLKAVEPKRGANQNIRGGEPPKVETRTSIAAAAGLSPDQAKEALRVASIPKREFELPVQPAAPSVPGCARFL